MPDYSSLGSQISTISDKINALSGSTLSSTDLLYLAESITLLGTALGINDQVAATNTQIAAIQAAGTSTIAVVNGTANGSQVSNLTTAYTSLYNLTQNLNPRVTSLEASSSAQNTAIATAAAQAAYAGYNPWVIHTSGTKTLVNKDRIMVVPASGMTLTLPAGPNTGDEVYVVDIAGTAATTNFTVARNGSLIMGQAQDLTFNVNNRAARIIYSNATYGWRVIV